VTQGKNWISYVKAQVPLLAGLAGKQSNTQVVCVHTAVQRGLWWCRSPTSLAVACSSYWDVTAVQKKQWHRHLHHFTNIIPLSHTDSSQGNTVRAAPSTPQSAIQEATATQRGNEHPSIPHKWRDVQQLFLRANDTKAKLGRQKVLELEN